MGVCTSNSWWTDCVGVQTRYAHTNNHLQRPALSGDNNAVNSAVHPHRRGRGALKSRRNVVARTPIEFLMEQAKKSKMFLFYKKKIFCKILKQCEMKKNEVYKFNEKFIYTKSDKKNYNKRIFLLLHFSRLLGIL